MRLLALLPFALTLAASLPALAQGDAPPKPSPELFTINNLWMMIATCMMFIMHLGFATLEVGLTRSKNTVNILFKNTFVVCIGLVTYALIGFNLMYPGEFNGVLGCKGFGIGTDAAGLTSAYNVGY